MKLSKDEELIIKRNREEKEFEYRQNLSLAVGKFVCEYCDYETYDKRYMGLHTQHNHAEKMEEWLRVYEDSIDESDQNIIFGGRK